MLSLPSSVLSIYTSTSRLLLPSLYSPLRHYAPYYSHSIITATDYHHFASCMYNVHPFPVPQHRS